MGLILIWLRDNAYFVFIGVPAANESNVKIVTNLDDIYNTSIAEIPSAGRYTVSMKLLGFYQTILEKTIGINEKGQNHLPVFFLRKFNVPLMAFKIRLDSENKEVVFEYDNGKLIDRLRKWKDKNEWLGKLFYRDKFIDWFYLKQK